MFCRHCGKEITNKDTKFCPHCGKSVDSPAATGAVGTVNPKVGQPSSNQVQEQPNIIDNYMNVVKKYAEFGGRSSRREYWLFFLGNILIAFLLGIVEGISGVTPDGYGSVLTSIYQLVVFIPSVAVAVRRVHDVNKTGWLLLVPIYNLVLVLRKGDPESNNYGPPPEY